MKEEKNKQSSLNVEQELQKRIEQVNEGVADVPKMQKKDYVAVAVVCVICLVGIVAGAFI